MKRTIRKVSKKPDVSISKLVLREIIGLTARDGNGLASSSSSSSSCVYIAGCVAVVFNAESGRQSHFVVSHRNPRPLSCVAVSEDGRFLAAGESGTQPAVLVWDTVALTLISELRSHLYGIRCIAFSPDGTHLVSVGGYIHLWEWRRSVLCSKLKACSSCSDVSSVSFSVDAKLLVTSGKKHLKFWVVGPSPNARLNKGVKSLAMLGKAVDLGLQKERTFVSTAFSLTFGHASDRFSLYALTEAGVLCYIDSGFSIRKSINIKVEKGFAVSVSNNLIACACSNGIVRLFATETLKHAGNILYTKDKKVHGEMDIVSHSNSPKNDSEQLSSLPDACACQFMKSEKLVVIYGDHSLCVWNIQDINQATRCYMLLAHSTCIWDIKNLCCDNLHDQPLACTARGCSDGITFATCSDDGFIKIWDFSLKPSSEVIADHQSSKSQSSSSTSSGTFERDSIELGFKSTGFRSLATSPDGKYLAAGDSNGSLHIYDLNDFDHTHVQDAHDSEILSLGFGLTRKYCVESKELRSEHYFLASGGRDQLINLYDSRRNFDLVKSIDDHSAAVTSVKLAADSSKILSCSADRSLVFRDAFITDDAFEISHHLHQTASQGTVYDMVVDSKMEIAVTVGQDKKISTFDIASGKLIRSFKHDNDFGDPIKVAMDPSCSYIVCSYSNKSLCLYNFTTGEMVAQAMGHSELITGVIFLPDCKHIISVGGDGCIFVWQLPILLATSMQQRIQDMYGPLSPKSLVWPVGHLPIISSAEKLCKWSFDTKESVGPESNHQVGDNQETLEYEFSVSKLPKWAQGKVTGMDVIPSKLDSASMQEAELELVSSLASDIQPYEGEIGVREACHSSLYGSSSYAGKNRSSPKPVTISSFRMDDRWSRVYTVCLSNSPELQNHETNMPVSLQSSLQGGTDMKNYNQCTLGLESQTGNVCLSNFKSISNESDCRHCDEAASDSSLDAEDHVDNFRAPSDFSHTRAEESDLFKKHFGSLSSTNKIKRENPSKRRRYSSHLNVPRDCSGKGIFDSASKNLIGNVSNRVEESFADPLLQIPHEQQTPDFNKQDCIDDKIFEVGERKQVAPQRSEFVGTLDSCREAILALDMAADNAAQLFLELKTSGLREDSTTRDKASLYAEASKLIPSVLENLKVITELVQNI